MSSDANAHNSTNLMELWKDWNETTIRMWSSILDSGKGAYGNPFGLYNFWMRSAGVAQEQWRTSPSRIIDPVEVWKLWADATVDAWRRAIEAYKSTVRAFYLVNEEMVQNIQMPTRSDITRVAELVVSLEERVYTIEDAFVNFEDGYFKVATDQVVEELAGRLERVEGKLDTSILERTEVIADLAERLERVESKLNILLVALEKIEARAYPEAVGSSDGGEVGSENTKEA